MDFPAVRGNKKARRDGKKSATPASLVCKQAKDTPLSRKQSNTKLCTKAPHNRGGYMPESASVRTTEVVCAGIRKRPKSKCLHSVME